MVKSDKKEIYLVHQGALLSPINFTELNIFIFVIVMLNVSQVRSFQKVDKYRLTLCLYLLVILGNKNNHPLGKQRI